MGRFGNGLNSELDAADLVQRAGVMVLLAEEHNQEEKKEWPISTRG